MSFLDPYRKANSVKRGIDRALYQEEMARKQNDIAGVERFNRIAQVEKMRYDIELTRCIVDSNNRRSWF